ncbi:MAG TPA: DNA-formamidopyrimidine glycosylase family protein [Actinomycetes bacterium]|jgi:formamidopyrimidine-DNA glycosylase|nr:DNA-formamidopyrimidine glycosylase family protein [Actinomycetes bacterium]
MPELPEVETLRQDLDNEVVGRKITDVEVMAARTVRRHHSRKEFSGRLSARRVVGVERRGSHLVLLLDSGDALVVTLAVTGRLRRERSSAPTEQGTDAVITFSTGGGLRVLHLPPDGELFVAPEADLDDQHGLQQAAIDPLTDAFTWRALGVGLDASSSGLRPLLTGGTLVAGIGPIYADEIVWTGGLRWDRDACGLSPQEVRRLYRGIQEVLQEAVRLRGTSVGDNVWLDLHGNKGEYQNHLNVYQRDGQPCRRCRTTLVVQTLDHDDRTYFCPRCQS